MHPSRREVQKLSRFRDSLSYLYVEHCVVEQEHYAIAVFEKDGKTSVPCANLSVLMLGPGSRITHSAVRSLTDSGCLILWVGEGGIRCYASALGKTRGAARLLYQARLVVDPDARLAVVRRMYEKRFGHPLDPGLKLQQIRGMEGARMRACYLAWSEKTGVPWAARDYNRGNWDQSDPVNRALSAANSCLYGICHAAIVACGYSPGLGFLHTGKMLSFVYDIADLYKADYSIPVAFECAAEGYGRVDSRARHRLRDLIVERGLIRQIIPDIHELLGYAELSDDSPYDAPDDPPGTLWDPEGEVEGGINYFNLEEQDHDGIDSGECPEGAEGPPDPLAP